MTTNIESSTNRILEQIERSPGEELQMSLSQFKGRDLFNVRIWVKDRHGEWVPTRRGINLYPHELEALIQAAERARDTLGEK